MQLVSCSGFTRETLETHEAHERAQGGLEEDESSSGVVMIEEMHRNDSRSLLTFLPKIITYICCHRLAIYIPTSVEGLSHFLYFLYC